MNQLLRHERPGDVRTRTMSKAEAQALVDAYEIETVLLLDQKEIHLIVATDRPRAGDSMTMTGTLTRAQAQALMDAHDIDPPSLDEFEIQRLVETNPDLLGAYTVLELIARYGKP